MLHNYALLGLLISICFCTNPQTLSKRQISSAERNQIRINDRYSVDYVVDVEDSTITFTVNTTYNGFVGLGFGKEMQEVIDAFVLRKTTDGWTVDNAYT